MKINIRINNILGLLRVFFGGSIYLGGIIIFFWTLFNVIRINIGNPNGIHSGLWYGVGLWTFLGAFIMIVSTIGYLIMPVGKYKKYLKYILYCIPILAILIILIAGAYYN